MTRRTRTDLRVWMFFVMVTVVVVSARGSSQSRNTPLKLQTRVLRQGLPVVLLGGGLLGADGWGGVPRTLAATRRVINVQSLAVQYGLEDRSLPTGYSIQTEVDALSRTVGETAVRDVDLIGYTVGDYDDDPARLRGLAVPALGVTGAQTVPFHRMINEALIRALPRAEALQLGAGHNSPVADPDHFVTEWRTFERRAAAARVPAR